MKPRDYALEIASLDVTASNYRVEVEIVIRRALADEGCRLATLIDNNFLEHRILYCSEAAQVCRDEAAEHLKHT